MSRTRDQGILTQRVRASGPGAFPSGLAGRLRQVCLTPERDQSRIRGKRWLRNVLRQLVQAASVRVRRIRTLLLEIVRVCPIRLMPRKAI